MNNYTFFTTVFFLCFSFASMAASDAQVVFSDSTFNNSDWQSFSEPLTGPLDASPAATIESGQETIGGNPGSYMKLTVSQSTPITDETSPLQTHYWIYAGITSSKMIYNPSTQGAIASIQYDVDLENIDYSGVVDFGVVDFAMKIDGNYYYAGSTPNSSIASLYGTQGWSTYSGIIIAPPYGFDAFSSSGATVNLPGFPSTDPIEFGILIPDVSNPLIGGSPTSSIGIDNFKVTINPVPEPSVWTMLLGGLGALTFFARRLATAVQ